MIVYLFVPAWMLLCLSSGEPCLDDQHCESCRSGTGDCITGCINGYFDSKCDQSCNQNCRNRRCKLGSKGIEECTDGCNPGYYGTRCTLPCDTPTDDLNCVSNCSGLHYGTACKSCPEGCTICNMLTGKCEDCPNCLGKECSGSEGCKEGCIPGFYKNNCEGKCSEHCILGCDQASGHCAYCKAGWYGPFCHLKCSPGCLDSCVRNGSCVNGCVRGLYGEKCNMTCPINCFNNHCLRDGTCNVCKDGFYGRECKNSCQNCDGVCDMYSGTCRKCKEYFTGSDCLKDCQKNCSRPGCDVYQICKPNKDYRSREVNNVPYFAVGAMVLVVFVLSTYVTLRLKRMNILIYGRTKSRREQPELCIPGDQASPSEVIHVYDEVNENEVNTTNQQSSIEFDNVVRDSSVFPYEDVHQDKHPGHEPESDMVEHEDPALDGRPEADVGVGDELHIDIPVQDECSGRSPSLDSVSSLLEKGENNTEQPIYSQYLTCVHET